MLIIMKLKQTVNDLSVKICLREDHKNLKRRRKAKSGSK